MIFSVLFRLIVFLYEIGQVVVIDNATFPKGERIQQLIHNTGCKLLYLPPYCSNIK
ncbi:transposase [Crinalium epipsammum]|uniref:transposase n=1 Tax=Crinalium epipsammum TaxID=241425 RepID=UPI0036F29DC3